VQPVQLPEVNPLRLLPRSNDVAVLVDQDVFAMAIDDQCGLVKFLPMFNFGSEAFDLSALRFL